MPTRFSPSGANYPPPAQLGYKASLISFRVIHTLSPYLSSTCGICRFGSVHLPVFLHLPEWPRFFPTGKLPGSAFGSKALGFACLIYSIFLRLEKPLNIPYVLLPIKCKIAPQRGATNPILTVERLSTVRSQPVSIIL